MHIYFAGLCEEYSIIRMVAESIYVFWGNLSVLSMQRYKEAVIQILMGKSIFDTLLYILRVFSRIQSLDLLIKSRKLA